MTRRHAAGLGGVLLGTALGGPGVAAQAATEEMPGNAVGRLKPPAEDRLEILELMALYAWAYDCEDAALLRRTFAPDGELVVFGRLLANARDGFDDFIAMAREMKGELGWQHLAGHHVFRDYVGDRCKVYSYYTMAQGDAGGGGVSMRAMGYYDTDFQRGPQGWRIARRAVVRWTGKIPFDIPSPD